MATFCRLDRLLEEADDRADEGAPWWCRLLPEEEDASSPRPALSRPPEAAEERPAASPPAPEARADSKLPFQLHLSSSLTKSETPPDEDEWWEETYPREPRRLVCGGPPGAWPVAAAAAAAAGAPCHTSYSEPPFFSLASCSAAPALDLLSSSISTDLDAVLLPLMAAALPDLGESREGKV